MSVRGRSLPTLKSLNRYSLSIGILLVMVVFSPDPGKSRFVSVLHDFAHAPVFGCVALLVLFWLSRHSPRVWPVWAQYVAAFLVAVLLGLATEVAQKFAARDPSWLDLLGDTLGAAACCGLFAAFDRRIARMALRACAALLAITLLMFHSLPLARVSLAYVHRDQEFPTLFDARDGRASNFARPVLCALDYVQTPAMFARHPEEPALRLRFGAGQWMGLNLDEPVPDWSGHRTLLLDLTNPGDTPLALAIRVHDRAHDWRYEDRFNRSFELAARTRKTIAIALADIERGPTARPLDLQKVANAMLFTSSASVGRELYVSRIWLE